MASISNLLLKHLDELEQDDFDRFKSSLRNDIPQGFDSIPRSRLERANHLKVVELMVDLYGESDAANITVHVLKQINMNKLASDLEKKLEGKVSGVSHGPATAQATKQSTGMVSYGVEFVDKHRNQLIQRVSSVMEIADSLLSKRMITAEVYSSIGAERTSQGQMRTLYTSLNSKAVKEEFYRILKEKQPHLVEDLQ